MLRAPAREEVTTAMAGNDRRGAGPRRPRTGRRLGGAPLATGWLLPGQAVNGELVVARFDTDDLPHALAVLHQTNRGHLARVLNGSRGDLAGQLVRAGVRVDLGFSPGALGADAALVLVNATGQVDAIGGLLLGAGAREVRVVGPGAAPPPSQDAAAEAVADG
ncbi:MAG: hypothetical protein AVDCRST_MAG49-2923 [uncultured Thermomicrobiales bacterium]|uniref:Uncharacterized protein n=1 Tax=uncultured Thermomicrobiales bacterium TaxID=1645740 RepID=A0A6J4UP78_9BACT|nr:MAG: hypothetical protein AVDCRST_MAG49-2923 [uncultured Thermomicrobiales bacterium]